MEIIKSNLIDIHTREIYAAEISIEGKHIKSIQRIDEELSTYICPGLIDAHIHIESSMLVPYEFARVALKHGTVATISDPHEIANVMGVEGVHYMIDNAKEAILKFHFGAPSCVPATSFETAGAVIDSKQIEELLALDDIWYLSEMMNYPGVLFSDAEVMAKIKSAHAIGKPIDGHAPGLMGADAKKYIDAGISTDHECYTIEEARDKLGFGMKVIIREGSAAKNYNALHPLIGDHFERLMFCSDDKHPDDLLEGHIDALIRRSLKLGYDLFDLLTMACKNPVEHYNMRVGLLKEGDLADFIIIDSPEAFNVLDTYVNGQKVATKDSCILQNKSHDIINQFSIDPIQANELSISVEEYTAPIIEALDGELITEKLEERPLELDEFFVSDTARDILKVAVINRYTQAKPAIGFIKNFGLKDGAIASTVAHDSHNIICVGTDDNLMAQAINLLVETKGGLSAVNTNTEMHIGLPIAGLMSDRPCAEIGTSYAKIDRFVKEMGTNLRAPFMTLSFMALLVIPKIKMSDKGVFDAEKFVFY